MSTPDPALAALTTLLAADATLTGLLGDGAGGFWHEVAPREALEPLVVLTKEAGGRSWQMTAHIRSELWCVKAVDRSLSASAAATIDRRLDTLLTDPSLAIAGFTVLYCRRETDVSYPEQDGADVFHHVGGLYRLIYTPV
jgi:hypothetical protein